MAFYSRIIGLTEPKLPVHGMHAAMGEIERGKLSGATVASFYGLDAGETAEAATLAARLIAPPEAYSLGGFATLTNIGTTFDAINASRSLGFVRLQVSGITSVDFTVMVNKVGAGTQIWQLWNETDAAEIGSISDAGAAGNKTLTTTITPGAPLAAGVKLIRVRARSTTASDDPLYYGASLTVRRVERLTAAELHEVLILAEDGMPGYETEANLKARLGVA